MDKGNPARPEGEAGKEMLDRMNRSHYEMTGWALDYLDFKENDHVLDVGCGGGMTLHRIAPKVPSGHLDGIDYSEVSVHSSSELNNELVENGKMTVQKADVSHLPFADGTFDKIVTVESFYFWPDPPENLKELSRVLKKGGRVLLVAEVYGDAPLSDHDRDNIREYHLFNPTKEEFRGIFERAGFKDIQIHTHPDTCWIAIDATV